MNRLLVTIDGQPNSIWQGFKEVCQVFELPYDTLKKKPYPRIKSNVRVDRLPWREVNNFKQVKQ